MLFEWDECKNRLNQQKHRLSFETASLVFDDPFLLITEDTNHEEQRFLAIGSIGGIVVILVAYQDKSNDRTDLIRIISARKLSKGEIKRYGYQKR